MDWGYYLQEEIYFPTTKYSYGFSDHLLHLFFTISFPNGSQHLATSVAINHYCTSRLTKISVAIFFLVSGKFGVTHIAYTVIY